PLSTQWYQLLLWLLPSLSVQRSVCQHFSQFSTHTQCSCHQGGPTHQEAEVTSSFSGILTRVKSSLRSSATGLGGSLPSRSTMWAVMVLWGGPPPWTLTRMVQTRG